MLQFLCGRCHVNSKLDQVKQVNQVSRVEQVDQVNQVLWWRGFSPASSSARVAEATNKPGPFASADGGSVCTRMFLKPALVSHSVICDALKPSHWWPSC